TLVNDVKHGGRDPGESPADAAKRNYAPVDLRHKDQLTVGNTSIDVQVVWRENCCGCGTEIVAEELKLAQRSQGQWMCGDCRGSVATVQPTPPAVVQATC